MKLQLLEKQMDRKEFLGHVGALFLAVIGVSGIVRFFMHGGAESSTMGYGSSAYGGKR